MSAVRAGEEEQSSSSSGAQSLHLKHKMATAPVAMMRVCGEHNN
jgi:hypothetical protein